MSNDEATGRMNDEQRIHDSGAEGCRNGRLAWENVNGQAGAWPLTFA